MPQHGAKQPLRNWFVSERIKESSGDSREVRMAPASAAKAKTEARQCTWCLLQNTKGNNPWTSCPRGAQEAARGLCGAVCHQPECHQPHCHQPECHQPQCHQPHCHQPQLPPAPSAPAAWGPSTPRLAVLAVTAGPQSPGLGQRFPGRHCELLGTAPCPPCSSTQRTPVRPGHTVPEGRTQATWKWTRPLIKLHSSWVSRDSSQSKNNAQKTAPLHKPEQSRFWPAAPARPQAQALARWHCYF